MADDKRYRKIMDRAEYLNEDAPWIYSDTWLEMFMDDLNTAFMIQDLDWIQELEDALK